MNEELDRRRPSSLTARELEVLEAAAGGLTDKQISAELGISRDTVASYWRRILLKYGAVSRTQVVALHSSLQQEAQSTKAERENLKLQKEIEERIKAQAQELAQRNLLSAITEASLAYISGQQGVKEVFHRLLDEVLSLTDSEYGFIGEVVYEEGVPHLHTIALTDISWDEETKALYQTHVREGLRFRNLQTLFGEVMTKREPVLANHVATDPRAAGRPVGHPPLVSFLGLPFFSGDEMIGMVGISNRPGGYDAELATFLKPFLATCANITLAWQAEEARKQAALALAQSHALVRALVDKMAWALLYENKERKLEYMNRRFCEKFGIEADPDQLVGMDCAQAAEQAKGLFADPEGFLTRVDDLLAGEESFVGERILMASGQTFERDFLVVRHAGDVRGYLWLYRDVTPFLKGKKKSRDSSA